MKTLASRTKSSLEKYSISNFPLVPSVVTLTRRPNTSVRLNSTSLKMGSGGEGRLLCLGGGVEALAVALGLPHRKVLFHHQLGGGKHQLFLLEGEQRLGMPRRETACPQKGQHLFRQAQQPHSVGHRWPGFGDLFGHLLLGHTKLLHQLVVAQRLFHGIQVFPLQVFH